MVKFKETPQRNRLCTFNFTWFDRCFAEGWIEHCQVQITLDLTDDPLQQINQKGRLQKSG